MDLPSGVVSHAQLQGVTIDQHHAQLHAAQHLLAGTDPLNSAIRQGQRISKVLTQSVTNSTTLVDDPDFQWNVLAGVNYMLELHMYITGLAVAGFRLAFVMPGGGVMRLIPIIQGYSGYLDAQPIETSGTAYVWATSDGSGEGLHLFGRFTPTSSGIAKMQWAQGTANATATNFAQRATGEVYPF